MIFNSVEKLKKNKILILSLLVISSQSITANVILVFITRMVRDVFGIAETENGIARKPQQYLFGAITTLKFWENLLEQECLHVSGRTKCFWSNRK